jgi:hypothetical protein
MSCRKIPRSRGIVQCADSIPTPLNVVEILSVLAGTAGADDNKDYEWGEQRGLITVDAEHPYWAYRRPHSPDWRVVP